MREGLGIVRMTYVACDGQGRLADQGVGRRRLAVALQRCGSGAASLGHSTSGKFAVWADGQRNHCIGGIIGDEVNGLARGLHGGVLSWAEYRIRGAGSSGGERHQSCGQQKGLRENEWHAEGVSG